MIYYGKEIATLLDIEILQAWRDIAHAEQKRIEASKHPKFDKTKNRKALDFPAINPVFLQLKNELKSEMDKRNLSIEE